MSGDTLGESTCFGIEEHHEGKKTGKTGRGGGFQKLPQITFSGGRGAIQEVISNLEKNKYILRITVGMVSLPPAAGRRLRELWGGSKGLHPGAQ